MEETAAPIVQAGFALDGDGLAALELTHEALMEREEI